MWGPVMHTTSLVQVYLNSNEPVLFFSEVNEALRNVKKWTDIPAQYLSKYRGTPQ